MSLPIETDLFHECRSGQHETCIRWLHSASPNPPVEIRCSCSCHGQDIIEKAMSQQLQERFAEIDRMSPEDLAARRAS